MLGLANISGTWDLGLETLCEPALKVHLPSHHVPKQWSKELVRGVLYGDAFGL